VSYDYDGLEEQYPHYAEAVQRNLDYWKSMDYENDAIFWKKKFEDLPDSIFINRKKINDSRTRSLSIPLSKFDRILLQNLAEQTKANVSQLTIAALLIYFGKTTEHNSFCFGLPSHKRRGRDER